jgi:pimeloyl-ACP methyl ester carboxylesterase
MPKLSYLYSTLILSVFLLSSCNSPKSQPTEVTPLPPDTKAKIEQDLKNGVIPSPTDIKKNNLGKVPDLCQEFKAEIPKDWFQDTLEVPEDPANPNGRKIKIFYYGKLSPNSIPTMFFNGGPGGTSHGMFYSMVKMRRTFDSEKKVSFVFFDQRGNGCSDFYPQGNSEETIQRLSHYGSSGIVSDAEHVRKKLLGEGKWNVFGQSYGGHIVHRYSIQSPEGVNAAFSHANVLQSDGYVRLKNRIASQVRVYKSYLQRFPEDQAKLLALKNYLTKDRCYINPYDKEETACGHELLDSLNMLLGFSESWLSLHQWIGLMVPSNEVSNTEVARYMAALYFDEDDSNPLNNKNLSSAVIAWTDRNVANGSEENCYKIKTELNAEGIDLEAHPVHECSSALQYGFDPNAPVKPDSPTRTLIKKLPQNFMTIEKLKTTLEANKNLNLYLYSGQLDSFVPVENFAEQLAVIKDLPNVHYTLFNGTGHNGYNAEPQVWTDIIKHSAK